MSKLKKLAEAVKVEGHTLKMAEKIEQAYQGGTWKFQDNQGTFEAAEVDVFGEETAKELNEARLLQNQLEQAHMLATSYQHRQEGFNDKNITSTLRSEHGHTHSVNVSQKEYPIPGKDDTAKIPHAVHAKTTIKTLRQTTKGGVTSFNLRKALQNYEV